ncbi:MAG: flagellar biosynthesis anti-sigma factor FlgM [Clostridiaceae bacterium]|jgi:negative regulator of flagellin synthesis FlgM|nr:flagellar biosynthesis anti-sigma factor FlgM [Clostridiaceae bacterium]
MNINGVSANKVIKLYGEIKKQDKVSTIKQSSDSIEISSLGKSLSSYSIDDKFVSNEKKIQALKNEVSNGTYNRDAKLIASKMLEAMKK